MQWLCDCHNAKCCALETISKLKHPCNEDNTVTFDCGHWHNWIGIQRSHFYVKEILKVLFFPPGQSFREEIENFKFQIISRRNVNQEFSQAISRATLASVKCPDYLCRLKVSLNLYLFSFKGFLLFYFWSRGQLTCTILCFLLLVHFWSKSIRQYFKCYIQIHSLMLIFVLLLIKLNTSKC